MNKFISQNQAYKLPKQGLMKKIKSDFLDILMEERNEKGIYNNDLNIIQHGEKKIIEYSITNDVIKVICSEEQLKKGFDFLGNYIVVQDSLFIGDQELSLYCDSKFIEPGRYNNEIDESYGLFLFGDFDDGNIYRQYFIRKKNNTYEIFEKEKKKVVIGEINKDGIVIVFDNLLINSMFRKSFLQLYHHYFNIAGKYISLTKGLLKAFKDKKYWNIDSIPDISESTLLFIDRDATVFRYIAQQIGEDYNIQAHQCLDFLFPDTIEKQIRLNISNHFGNRDVDYSRIDTLAEKLFEYIDEDQLRLFKEIMDKTVGDRSDMILVDTGVFGSTTKISQLFLQYLYPDKKIYSALLYGLSDTAKYIDFIMDRSQSASNSCHAIENRPKPFDHLDHFDVHNEDIVEMRKPQYEMSSQYDTEIIKQIMLDKSCPTSSQVFFLALGNRLDYIKKGIIDKRREISFHQRVEVHTKKYGL